MITSNKKLLSIFLILAILIFASAFLIYISSQREQQGLGKVLSQEQAIQRALDYINQNLLRGENKATLLESSEERGLYKFKLKIGEQEFESYVTKDGSLLFPEAIVLKEVSESTESLPELPKRERPDVKLFVMSYCPFGLQMEKALFPVYQLLKDKIDIGIYFVDYIMHEKKEMDENLRQYCIQKEEPAKFFSYLECFVKEGNYQECLNRVDIDQTRLSSCISAADKEFNVTKNYEDKESWLGGRFPQFEVHAHLNEKYGVRGSPTLVINDKVVQAERSPEGVKKVICQAFSLPPQECSQTLSEKVLSPGFGERPGGSSGGQGSCG